MANAMQMKKRSYAVQAKSGTTHFHGYATVSIVHDNQRYVLALRFVEKGESMEKIVTWLLNRLKSMGISIRCAYFDKGFCSVPVLKTLQRRKIKFIMPIPVRGKSGGVRKLFESASHKTTYTFNSPQAWRIGSRCRRGQKVFQRTLTNEKVLVGLLTRLEDCQSLLNHTKSLRCIVNDLELKRVIGK